MTMLTRRVVTTMSREELGWALLFSLPVGFGVAVAVLRQSAGHDATVAAIAGLVTAIAIFLLVALGVYQDDDADE